MVVGRIMAVFGILFILMLPGIAELSNNPEADVQLRLTYARTLKEANIDSNSNDSLLKSCTDNNIFIVFAAVFFLSERQDKRVVPLLQKRLEQLSTINKLSVVDAMVAYHYCEALGRLGEVNGSWKDVCCLLMQDGRRVDHQYRAAALLAQQGDGQGWPVVRDMLLTSQDEQLLMCLVDYLPVFDGLKYNEDGVKIINVADFCTETAKMNLARIEVLQYTLAKVAKPRDEIRLRKLHRQEGELQTMLAEIIRELTKPAAPATPDRNPQPPVTP